MTKLMKFKVYIYQCNANDLSMSQISCVFFHPKFWFRTFDSKVNKKIINALDICRWNPLSNDSHSKNTWLLSSECAAPASHSIGARCLHFHEPHNKLKNKICPRHHRLWMHCFPKLKHSPRYFQIFVLFAANFISHHFKRTKKRMCCVHFYPLRLHKNVDSNVGFNRKVNVSIRWMGLNPELNKFLS